jgi:tetratricopeptide (TPR) repeat protein
MNITQEPGQHVFLELRARDAWTQREYRAAREIAGEAQRAADANGNENASWNMVFLQIECLKKEGLFGEAASTAEALRLHPLTRRYPDLAARVSTILADTLVGRGNLESAVVEGHRAVDASEQASGSPDLQIRALHTLIAALAESDRIDDAWKECLRLAELITPDVNSQTAGKAYWVIGNVAYLRRDAAVGTDYHRRAASNLSPSNDLDLWARFNRASAALRLAGGVVEPETLECIERAELAASIVGGSDRDKLELSLTRAHWLFLTGQFDAAVERLKPICEASSLLASQTAAEAYLLLGQALARSGDPLEGLFQLEKSQELFRQSGAHDREAHVGELIDEVHRRAEW